MARHGRRRWALLVHRFPMMRWPAKRSNPRKRNYPRFPAQLWRQSVLASIAAVSPRTPIGNPASCADIRLSLRLHGAYDSSHGLDHGLRAIQLNIVAAPLRDDQAALWRKGGKLLLEAHQGRLPFPEVRAVLGRSDHDERHIRKRTGIPDLLVAFGHTLLLQIGGCSRHKLRTRLQLARRLGAGGFQQDDARHILWVLSCEHLHVEAAQRMPDKNIGRADVVRREQRMQPGCD